MTAASLLATVVMGCAVAGCVHTGFARTTGLAVPARAPGCSLDIVFQGPPPYPYVVIGQVMTNASGPEILAIGQNDVVAMRRVTEAACAAGAHGLMNIATSSERVRVGKGHWKTTRGAAMAFVYVDAFGRPLSAPEGRLRGSPASPTCSAPTGQN